MIKRKKKKKQNFLNLEENLYLTSYLMEI
jgi:hypothetical protein